MTPIVSDIEIKKVNAGRLLTVLVTGSYEKMGDAFMQLSEWMEQKLIKPSGPFCAIFYDTVMSQETKKVRYEVCVQIDKDIEGEDIIKYREDFDQECAVLTFRGPYDKINIAYDALFNWIKSNSYQVDGACREVYIVSPKPDAAVDPETFVTEIQLPVKKAE